jgi:hypothetical protein
LLSSRPDIHSDLNPVAWVGFTGTRNGMTSAQKRALTARLPRVGWLSHGDCLGADEEADAIAKAMGLCTCAHPPLSPRLRAYCRCDHVYPPRDYLERNQNIVRTTHELFAAPLTEVEQHRSGTWATVRYARQLGKKITLIMPNGSVRIETPRGVMFEAAA